MVWWPKSHRDCCSKLAQLTAEWHTKETWLGKKVGNEWECFLWMGFLLSPVVNKSKMLSAGVADVVLKFLPSEMPPVQFKLLGTLRMLIDTQGRDWIYSTGIDNLNSKLNLQDAYGCHYTNLKTLQVSVDRCSYWIWQQSWIFSNHSNWATVW